MEHSEAVIKNKLRRVKKSLACNKHFCENVNICQTSEAMHRYLLTEAVISQ